jgi:hypothetical protein
MILYLLGFQQAVSNPRIRRSNLCSTGCSRRHLSELIRISYADRSVSILHPAPIVHINSSSRTWTVSELAILGSKRRVQEPASRSSSSSPSRSPDSVVIHAHAAHDRARSRSARSIRSSSRNRIGLPKDTHDGYSEYGQFKGSARLSVRFENQEPPLGYGSPSEISGYRRKRQGSAERSRYEYSERSRHEYPERSRHEHMHPEHSRQYSKSLVSYKPKSTKAPPNPANIR